MLKFARVLTKNAKVGKNESPEKLKLAGEIKRFIVVLFI